MDILGNSNSDKETMTLQQLENQVHRELSHLDPNLSLEYRQAIASVPALVARECRILDFLRTEDFDPIKAAHRVALYWKTRFEFYGKERWLLPMSQTGKGTLCPQQVELLRSGVLAPTFSNNGTANQSGFAVLTTNRFRLPPGASFLCPQVILYILSVATGEQAQTTGITLFHVIDPPRGQANTQPLPKPTPEILHKIATSLPIRVRNIVVARSFDPATPSQMLETMAARQQRLAQQNFGTVAEYVMGDSLRSSLTKLEERGLDRACIPFALGGDYFYTQQFNEWIRARLSVEEVMSSAPPVRNTELSHAITECALTHQQTFAPSMQNEDSSNHHNEEEKDGMLLIQPKPGESRQEFVRRRANFYNRRSYNKKRRGQEHIKHESEALQLVHAALQAENQRLQELLTQAQHVLAAHQHDSVPQE